MPLRVVVAILCLIALRVSMAPAAVDSPPDATTGPTTSPVPLLSAQDAIASMNLPPGFRMEVVAEEPMIEHPVAMSFDADGRMWVVQMRSYMPSMDGTGENAPTGRISILEDTNDDGRADKITIFMDNLVLPRAVAPVRDGALVGVPPNLLFCRDTNADGTADEQTVIANDYATGGNPEHASNGLMTALDNWNYSAAWPKRLRFLQGRWTSEPIPSLGQWGISQDDHGRLFHNGNADHLRGSLIPPHYAERHPHYRGAGANVEIAFDQTVWPAHSTAVNRGYLAAVLRDDWTLRKFTAACGPHIYRGGLFGDDVQGNAFVCEPSANVIRRSVLSEADGVTNATNAYEGKEFIASTYERFRPVNLCTGPDGALYVVDMHQGLLQHEMYLTTYLKQQYRARALDKHRNTGRIYRIVPEKEKLYPRPQLSKATPAELMNALSHPNGWWRDTAQRLLVERGDYAVGEALRKRVASDANPLARLHAFWTLEGLRVADSQTVLIALRDGDPRIRASAIRLCEPYLATPRRATVLPAMLKLADDADPKVRLQLALTLSGAGGAEAEKVSLQLLCDNVGNTLVRDAVISGLRGREIESLEALLSDPDWATETRAHTAVLRALARCVVFEGKPRRVQRLLDLVTQQTDTVAWRRLVLLDAFPDPIRGRRLRSIILDGEPEDLIDLREHADDPLRTVLEKVFATIHWDGQPGFTPSPPPKPLSPQQQQRFDAGKLVYAATCSQCHKPDGLGQAGIAPALADSEWVLGAHIPARIVLQGLQGPVTVNGQTFNLDMPALPALSDQQIADVLTYVRREWDHEESPVEVETITQVRKENAQRVTPWTEWELLKLK